MKKTCTPTSLQNKNTGGYAKIHLQFLQTYIYIILLLNLYSIIYSNSTCKWFVNNFCKL